MAIIMDHQSVVDHLGIQPWARPAEGPQTDFEIEQPVRMGTDRRQLRHPVFDGDTSAGGGRAHAAGRGATAEAHQSAHGERTFQYMPAIHSISSSASGRPMAAITAPS